MKEQSLLISLAIDSTKPAGNGFEYNNIRESTKRLSVKVRGYPEAENAKISVKVRALGVEFWSLSELAKKYP